MNRQTTRISPADVDRQRDFCQKLHERFAARPSAPLAFVDTYGCQQNEADSERLRGYLSEMGYQFTQSEAEADLIVINTCAIREHAEMRVLGNVGALVHTKRAKPGQLICVCGCMAQEPHMAQKIKDSYRRWSRARRQCRRCAPGGSQGGRAAPGTARGRGGRRPDPPAGRSP